MIRKPDILLELEAREMDLLFRASTEILSRWLAAPIIPNSQGVETLRLGALDRPPLLRFRQVHSDLTGKIPSLVLAPSVALCLAQSFEAIGMHATFGVRQCESKGLPMPRKVERNIKIPHRLRRMAWEATDTFRQEKDFGLSAVTSGDNIYAINLKGYGAKSKVVELMRKADLVSDAAQQEAKKRTARRQIELMESQFRAGTAPP